MNVVAKSQCGEYGRLHGHRAGETLSRVVRACSVLSKRVRGGEKVGQRLVRSNGAILNGRTSRCGHMAFDMRLISRPARGPYGRVGFSYDHHLIFFVREYHSPQSRFQFLSSRALTAPVVLTPACAPDLSFKLIVAVYRTTCWYERSTYHIDNALKKKHGDISETQQHTQLRGFSFFHLLDRARPHPPPRTICSSTAASASISSMSSRSPSVMGTGRVLSWLPGSSDLSTSAGTATESCDPWGCI